MTISRSKFYHVLQARNQHLAYLNLAFNCITVPEGSISGLVDQLVMIAQMAPCPYTLLNISHKTGEPFVLIIHSLLIHHHNWETPITYLFARKSKQLIRKSSDSRPCHKSNILCGKIHTAHTFSNKKTSKIWFNTLPPYWLDPGQSNFIWLLSCHYYSALISKPREHLLQTWQSLSFSIALSSYRHEINTNLATFSYHW